MIFYEIPIINEIACAVAHGMGIFAHNERTVLRCIAVPPEIIDVPVHGTEDISILGLFSSFIPGRATVVSGFQPVVGCNKIAPIPGLIQRVTEAHSPGIPFGPVPTFGGSTTSIYFRQRGIAAYGYSPVPANITDSARRHSNDERIYLRDYVDGVGTYRDLLLEFAFEGHNKTSWRTPQN